MPITIENVEVKKILYYNQQTNWGVLAVITKDKELKAELVKNGFEFSNKGYNDIIVTGNFEGIYEGCKLTITAEFAEHPKYGKQLQIQRFKVLEDTSSKDSIINFLTKSSINGIHKALAEKIYAQFKENSINTVLHQTEKLKEIKGIGDKTYEVVKKSVEQYFDMEELLEYCSLIGLTKFALIMQLYKEFGDKAVTMLKENPYQLLVRSEALTFNQVDEIALKAGAKADDDNRLMYGLLYILNRESVLCGSTGCADQRLKQVFLKTLGVQNNQLYRYAITKLDKEHKIQRDDFNVYPSDFYNAELHVANMLTDLNKPSSHTYSEKIIDEEIHNFDFTLNDDQVKAVHSCLENQFSTITGAAGTGKSTITKAVTRVIERTHGNVIMLAPTAKAAKRLEEASGFRAMTIHRFLKIKDSSLESAKEVIVPRNSTIVIDEASMVDIRLFEKLLEHIITDTRVILAGDINQLPSVQAGNLLEDIISSDKFNVCYLREITRQAEDSNIIKYSTLANEGQMIPLSLRTKDLSCISVNSMQRAKLLEALKEGYAKSVEKFGLLNVQVICAYKQGILGVGNLNKELKPVVNKLQPSTVKDDEQIFPFSIGDKVRHTINNYELDVFNGETGVVVDMQNAVDDDNYEGKDILTVDYGDRYVKYDKFTAAQLTLSYASTVHASQGSEYDCVYVILDNEISNILLVKKIVYTAITRAKKKCYILNVDGCVNTAISNDHYRERITKLKDFLIG